MLNGLRDFLFGNSRDSKSLARSRLHFVLVQDRAGLSPEEMTQFKKELVGVIEKYFMIDEKGFDIDYKRDSETTTLLINSPVVVKRQDSPGYDVGSRRNQKKGKASDKDKNLDKASENGAASSVG